MKWFYLYIILIISSSIPLRAQGGYSWNAADGLVSEDVLKSAYARYPKIYSRYDLTKLMRFIQLSGDFSSLNFVWKNGTFQLNGKIAKRISKIEIETFSRATRQQLYNNLNKFVGRTDSDETGSVIILQSNNVLNKRGFPLSKLSLTKRVDDSGVIYQIVVKETPPCLIDRVVFKNLPPRGVDLDFESGEICDVKMLESKVRELNDELDQDGYSDYSYKVSSFSFDAETNLANVEIDGNYGVKIRYQIVTEDSDFYLDSFFKDDEIEDIDPKGMDLDSLKSEIVKGYRSGGFYDVSLKSAKTIDETPHSKTIVFQVIKSSKYYVSSVNFTGASYFNEDRLARLLGISGVKPTDQLINDQRIAEGRDEIEALYKENGFLDIVVSEPIVTRTGSKGFLQVFVKVDEGYQYILNKLKIVGNSSIKTDFLKSKLNYDLGSPLEYNELANIKSTLADIYYRRGNIYVDFKLNLSKRRVGSLFYVDLNVSVLEGPRVKIGEVVVKGLLRTKRKVVTRELLFDQGDWYLVDLVERTRSNLTNLGLFSSVTIRFSDQDQILNRSGEVDLLVEVRESLPGSISFGPGWSFSNGSRFRIDFTYGNLNGEGRQIFAKAKVSEEKRQRSVTNKTLLGRQFTLGYQEPWLLNIPVDGQIVLNHRAQATEFWTLSNSAEAVLKHRVRMWLKDTTLSLFYRIEFTDEVQSREQISTLISSNNIRVGTVGFRLRMDERNDLKWPTKGFFFSSEIGIAREFFGGELDYLHWGGTLNYYFKIFGDFSFAGGLSYESFDQVRTKLDDSPNVLPSAERVYAGGGETVRGFQDRSLGPKVNVSTGTRDKVGGSRRFVAKTELRYRLAGAFGLSLFADMGNVWFSKDEASEFQNDIDSFGFELFDNIKYRIEDFAISPKSLFDVMYLSYGIAFKLLTPLGALNIAYGIPAIEPLSNFCKTHQCSSQVKHKEPIYGKGNIQINFGVTF